MPVECSPLSCNDMSPELPVNPCCLIDDFERAYEIAARFGSEVDSVEPGPYYLFQVFRRRPTAVSA